MLEEGGLECRLEANRAELSLAGQGHVTKLANLGSSSQQDMGIYEVICHDKKTVYGDIINFKMCPSSKCSQKKYDMCANARSEECASM